MMKIQIDVVEVVAADVAADVVLVVVALFVVVLG